MGKKVLVAAVKSAVLRRRAVVLAMTSCVAMSAVASTEAAFPTRRVRYVVPYAAGGPTDAVGRLVAEELSVLWGQAVYVDNRPGANAILGADLVARSPADGYTLLQGTSSTHGSNPVVFARLPYDATRDFVPVVPLIEGPVYLCVSSHSRFRSVAGLVAFARARPGVLNYGTSGVGSPQHLAGEMLKNRAGIDVLAVHYNGAAPARAALERGEIEFYFDSTPLLHEKTGQVRVLGVGSAQRWPLAPHVPTVKEGGIDDFELMGWFGLFAPAGTPPDVVARINTAVNTILAYPHITERLQEMGYRPRGGTSVAFTTDVRRESARWAELVRVNRIKVD